MLCRFTQSKKKKKKKKNTKKHKKRRIKCAISHDFLHPKEGTGWERILIVQSPSCLTPSRMCLYNLIHLYILDNFLSKRSLLYPNTLISTSKYSHGCPSPFYHVFLTLISTDANSLKMINYFRLVLTYPALTPPHTGFFPS